MKIITLILNILFPVLSFSQVDFQNPPWQIGCDTVETQVEMNICSYESFKIADSLLTKNYNELTQRLTKLYETELKDAVASKEYLKVLKKQIAAVALSHKKFILFRASMADIISYEYAGGSMRPLAVNSYALVLTVAQLKTLIDLMTEIAFE